jgi:hypothetical protein
MGVTDVMSGYLMLVLGQLYFVLFKEDGTKRKSADREASIIYLPRILCLSFVLSYSCHPVIFAER